MTNPEKADRNRGPAAVAAARSGAYSVADFLRAMLADNPTAATATLIGLVHNLIERVGTLEGRMDRLEARMDKLEARMDKLEERLINIDTAVTDLRARFDAQQRFQWITLSALIVLAVTSLVVR